MKSVDSPAELAFADFGFSSPIEAGIERAGFIDPRPIQHETIPAALAGRDIMGLAQTGTGKTAAFALPMIERLYRKNGPGPRALIVAPTRELAQQIDAELQVLASHTHVRSVTIYGGVSARNQIEALRRRPAIVVACPGRLLDLLGSRDLSLRHVEMLVLDEADHMFDMGFLPDIKRILAALPAKRQNLLFSATMPAEIRGLANSLLNEPHVVELAHSAPAETIEHAIYPTGEKEKGPLLEQLLDSDDLSSAIVFTRTKYRARRLAQKLERLGHRAVALQGNMSQNKRDEAMRGFRQRKFDVLVATDIAARGIDVAKVSHVINYDVPNTVDAYTHRIGRTGRAELAGKAFTFATPEDRPQIRAIERRIGASIVRLDRDGTVLPAEAPERAAPKRQRSGAGRGQRQGQGHHGQGQGRGGQGGGRGGSRGDASSAPRRRRRRHSPQSSAGQGRDGARGRAAS